MTLGLKLGIDYYIGGALHVLLKPFVVALGVLLRRDHDLSRCRDVTLLKLMGGGSLVIAYPALLAFHAAPQVRRLRLVTSPSARPFAELLGVFDEILVIDDRTLFGLLRTSLKVIWCLFRTDALVDLEIHSRLTTVFCLLTCARNRIGFYTGQSFWRKNLSTHLLFCNLNRGIYHFYDQLVQLFGAPVPNFEDCITTFRAAVGGFAPGVRSERHVGVATCCSDLAQERMLDEHEWASVLAGLVLGSQIPVRLHFLGGGSDRGYIGRVAALLAERVPQAACEIHAGSLSLRASVELMAKLDEFWSIDSGLLHYARLLGLPTVSFWGPSDPQTRLRPSLANRDVVHYSHVPCSPCVHLCAEAPCGGNNVCMRASVSTAGAPYLNPMWVLARHLTVGLAAQDQEQRPTTMSSSSPAKYQ